MASELDALLARVDDEHLRRDLTEHFHRLRHKRQFGLVFEAHMPERVRLPDHPIRVGVGAVRKDADPKMAPSRVARISDGTATLVSSDGEIATEAVDDLVAVAEFGQPIYPGLRYLDSVSRGGERPAHVVIKGENYHALEALQFTHAGKIDCIYIDPPYNTGARDWKYDNDYVDDKDAYRHSKWLAFMERRLQLAQHLLNPECSVLIVAIDENEVHRLGLLLEQTFRGATSIQTVTSVTNPRGKHRDGGFSRTEENLFFVTFGSARVAGEPDEDFSEGAAISWRTLRRSDIESRRGTAKGGTNQFYPIYVNVADHRIEAIGEPLPHDQPQSSAPSIDGCVAVFPMRDDGTEMNWGLTPESLKPLHAAGFVRLGSATPDKPQKYQISYLTSGRVDDIKEGRAVVVGHEPDGAVVARYVTHKIKMPPSTWMIPSHNAETGGTNMLKALLGEKRFDYPKSLYAVEDCIRYFVGDKPTALILDFFAGSGTTAHAVARLNHQDGGRRQSISITNDEMAATEADALREAGFGPGDEEWDQVGIFERVTRPRIVAAVTGLTPDGKPVPGEYRYVDEFPMAEGFEENVEFFELTYLDAEDVQLDLAFAGVAPLLWLRAGAEGPILGECLDGAGRRKPYAYTDTYGVLFNPDCWRTFVERLPGSVRTVFVVTDSPSEFSGIVAELPTNVEAVRLYENYLSTFAINQGR